MLFSKLKFWFDSLTISTVICNFLVNDTMRYTIHYVKVQISQLISGSPLYFCLAQYSSIIVG
jgi:hypothetical protein